MGNEHAIFKSGDIYSDVDKRGCFYRFICANRVAGTLLFMRVGEVWMKNSRLAYEGEKEELVGRLSLGKIRPIGEFVRPGFMSMSDEELRVELGTSPESAQAQLNARDEAFGRIKDLVSSTEVLALAYGRATSASVVAAHARLVGANEVQIRRDLTRYAWFGLQPNSMIPLHALKGYTSGTPKNFKKKTGRPNSAVVLKLGSKHEGRNVRLSDIKIFLFALQVFYVGQGKRLTQTYEAMCEHSYVKQNQHGVASVSEGRIPTLSQFLYWAQKLIDKYNLEALRAGRGKTNDKEIAGEGLSIAKRPGDVFDSDGTPFNRELLASFKVLGSRPNIGKGTFIAVQDRWCQYILGWHFYVGAENWTDGYRLAIFSALTSKKPQLEWLGIDEPNAFPDELNIRPAGFYTDNGPGSSAKAQAALMRLNIDPATAPPATPDWKGGVEGVMGMSQEDQATNNGGYRRTNLPRDKEARRLAKLFADKTAREVERRIVMWIIKQNNRPIKHHLLTEEMRLAGTPPTAQGIMSYFVKKSGGIENRRLPEAEVYRNLLTHTKQPLGVTRDGVSLLGAHYNSHALRALYTVGDDKQKIDVLYTDARPNVAFWIKPDGQLDTLTRSSIGDRQFGHLTAHEIGLQLQYDNAALIVEKVKPKKKPISKKQADLVKKRQESAGYKTRRRPHGGGAVVRAIEAAAMKKDHPFDKLDLNSVADAPEEVAEQRTATSSPAGSPMASASPEVDVPQADVVEAATAPPADRHASTAEPRIPEQAISSGGPTVQGAASGRAPERSEVAQSPALNTGELPAPPTQAAQPSPNSPSSQSPTRPAAKRVQNSASELLRNLLSDLDE